MNSKRNALIFTLIIILMQMSLIMNVNAQGNGYYAPKGSRTAWILEKDDTNSFLLYDDDTMFYGYVVDSDINSDILEVSLRTNRNIMTTDPHSEKIINYNDMTCHPFYETRSNLQWTPTGYVTIVELPEKVLGVTRNVTTLEIYDEDNTGLNWVLKYDHATGILIEWRILLGDGDKETVVRIQSTDAWVTISPLLQNLWWILLLIGIAVVSIVLLVIWIRKTNRKGEIDVTGVETPLTSVVFENNIDDILLSDF